MQYRYKRAVAAVVLAAVSLHAAAAGAVSFRYRVPLHSQGVTVPKYDPATAEIVALAASQTEVVAGTVPQVTLVARVADSKGVAAPDGQLVTWSADVAGLGALSTGTSGGEATTTFNLPNVHGTYTVTAGLAPSSTRHATIQVVANESAARVASVSATTPSVTVGGNKTPLTAMLHDSYGNPLGAGVLVQWLSTGGTLDVGSSTTDASGVARNALASPALAGAAAVTAQVPNGDAGKTANVTFSPDFASARVATVSSNATTAFANGQPAVTFSATIKDAYGNLLPGTSATWTASNGSFNGPTTTTSAAGSDGVAYAVLYASTVAGPAGVTVRGAVGDGGRTAGINLVADPSSARTQTINASPYRNLCSSGNGPMGTGLYAVVVDQFGNRQGAGVQVTWYRDGKGTIDRATSVTDANGVAAAWFSSVLDGTYQWATVYAIAQNGNSGSPITIESAFCK